MAQLGFRTAETSTKLTFSSSGFVKKPTFCCMKEGTFINLHLSAKSDSDVLVSSGVGQKAAFVWVQTWNGASSFHRTKHSLSCPSLRRSEGSPLKVCVGGFLFQMLPVLPNTHTHTHALDGTLSSQQERPVILSALRKLHKKLKSALVHGNKLLLKVTYEIKLSGMERKICDLMLNKDVLFLFRPLQSNTVYFLHM